MDNIINENPRTFSPPPVESFDQAIEKLEIESSAHEGNIAEVAQDKIKTVENVLDFPKRIRTVFLGNKKPILAIGGVAVAIGLFAYLAAAAKNNEGRSKTKPRHD